MANWDENVCSKCVYSIFDMDHINTIPSIHICYNRKSEHYEEPMAWCSSCSEFLSGEQRDEIIRAAWGDISYEGLEITYDEEEDQTNT